MAILKHYGGTIIKNFDQSCKVISLRGESPIRFRDIAKGKRVYFLKNTWYPHGTLQKSTMLTHIPVSHIGHLTSQIFDYLLTNFDSHLPSLFHLF